MDIPECTINTLFTHRCGHLKSKPENYIFAACYFAVIADCP
jgi:hypothetical protein